MTRRIAPMSIRSAMKHCGLLLALFAGSAAAWADCVDGSRNRTTQEQAFAEKLAASMRAAMPAAPVPLALEREPQVILQPPCKDTPEGKVSALVSADYAASLHYSDRVKVTVRANYAYPDTNDLVLGTLPKKPAPFKVQNLVVKVDGHNAQYVGAVKQALDRDRLQALVDQPLPETPPPAAWTVGGTSASKASASPASTASATTASAASTAASTPESAPTASDPTQAVTEKAKDAVNKLRGLFGR